MNDISEMLTDSAARLFDDVCTRESHDEAEAGNWLPKMWASIDAVGLTSLDACCEDASSELAIMAAVAKTAGAFTVPLPIVENLAARRMLRIAGLGAHDGPTTIATNLPQNRLKLQHEGSRFVLSGQLKRVPWGRHCTTIVATALADDGIERTVRLTGMQPDRLGKNLAGEARDDFRLDNVLVEADAVGQASRDARLPTPFHEGALLRGFQIAGALERVLQMSVQYSCERAQFGRPIAKFQAIQHQIAELAGHVASARVAVDAALVVAQSHPAAFEIAAAKLAASEAATAGYAIAHQVHGAMGFTHEHALHLSTRRLMSWRDEYGSEFEWAAAAASQLRNIDSDALWQFITAPHEAVANRKGD
ncbi:acyl-CoA dehydrogenase family protein [Cupriavidus sp. BIS7]|uniref:acyl-CoA dehydrogenase family protein n=1 Tax=Cupriavidus sp. BIS7 TaxID=1217718 RepID=UPI0003613A6F|nr:acyl-CoA dehydrogenase family protein [Cupriavidus sp. BIS7]